MGIFRGALAGAILFCSVGYASADPIISGFGTNVGPALGTATEASGGFGRINGPMVSGNYVKWSALGFQDSGIASGSGGGGLPTGGTSSQVLVGGATPSWGIVPQAAMTVPINSQTGSYTIAASDQGKLVVNVSGANTFSITSATTLGANWATNILNTGAALLTVHSLGGTINGSAIDYVLDPGDAIVLVSDGTNFSAMAATGFPARYKYIANKWYYPYAPANTVTGGAEAAGTVLCHQARVLRTVTISSLGIYIAVAGSSNIQLAIYNDSIGGQPGTEIDSTVNISDTFTGAKFGALGASHQLSPGVYWWCANQGDSTVQYESFSNTSTIMGETVGSTSLSDVMSIGHIMVGVKSTVTFGTWGDFTGVTFTNVTNAIMPLIAFLAVSSP